MRALGMAVGINNAGRHTSESKRRENGSRKQGKNTTLSAFIPSIADSAPPAMTGVSLCNVASCRSQVCVTYSQQTRGCLSWMGTRGKNQNLFPYLLGKFSVFANALFGKQLQSAKKLPSERYISCKVFMIHNATLNNWNTSPSTTYVLTSVGRSFLQWGKSFVILAGLLRLHNALQHIDSASDEKTSLGFCSRHGIPDMTRTMSLFTSSCLGICQCYQQKNNKKQKESVSV